MQYRHFHWMALMVISVLIQPMLQADTTAENPAGNNRGVLANESVQAVWDQCQQQLTAGNGTVRSQLNDAAGVGMLGGAGDRISALLYYGHAGLKERVEPLTALFFSKGKRISPLNKALPATVRVDGKEPDIAKPGRLQVYADVPEMARVMSVQGTAYPACALYSRVVLVVDTDKDHAYVVEFATVIGGKQHVYVAPNAQGMGQYFDGKWEKQEDGTVAWADGACLVQYDVENGLTMRLHLMPEEGTKVVLEKQEDSAGRYVREVRSGEQLRSVFATVIDAFGETASIESVKRSDLEPGATYLVVQRADKLRDIIVYNPEKMLAAEDDLGVITDALVAVFTVDADDTLKRVMYADGTILTHKERDFTGGASINGSIKEVNLSAQEIRVAAKRKMGREDMTNRIAFIENEGRHQIHQLDGAGQNGEVVTVRLKEPMVYGQLFLTRIDAQSVETNKLEGAPEAYVGLYLVDAGLNEFYRITKVEQGADQASWTLQLAKPLNEHHSLQAHSLVTLSCVGPDDNFRMPITFSWKP